MGAVNVLTARDLSAPLVAEERDPLRIRANELDAQIAAAERDLEESSAAFKKKKLAGLREARAALDQQSDQRLQDYTEAALVTDARQRELNAAAVLAIEAAIEAGHAALDHWLDYNRSFRAAVDIGVADVPHRIRAESVLGNVSDLRAMLNRYANLT